MEGRDNSIHRRFGASLFEPDILATMQYCDCVLYARRLDPEKMLMIAVLDDAVTCFRKWSFASSARAKERYQEVHDWFMSERSDQLFGFETICEVLGLNPDYIRAGLIYRQKHGDRDGARRFNPSVSGVRPETPRAQKNQRRKTLNTAGSVR